MGGFLPAVKQIANVAALPGIVGVSVLLKSITKIDNLSVMLINTVHVYTCTCTMLHVLITN